MNPDNSLRLNGHLNFFVHAHTYGAAKTCHAALLHYWFDLIGDNIPKPSEDFVESESMTHTNESVLALASA